ncbi:MAG: type I restriction-modification system subunit M [Thermoguttaceae bacterium]|nr:type I restriction-modification system subunit M [Thermoguttaceae bacterium]
MIDVKKEQERAELHAAIWKIADDLRGSVDGWDFKAYVLGAMFYRFLSENLVDYLDANEHDAGNMLFRYAKIKDEEAEKLRAELVRDKGFFILPSELFQNVVAGAKTNAELNITLARTFRNIEQSAIGTASEPNFRGLFGDFDVNSPKLGATLEKKVETLRKILNGVDAMNLRYSHNTIDAFGDAYEFLMTMYASNAGKSGGEFFTPQEVSELLAKIVVSGRKKIRTAYDPACGSGSLLLKVAQEVENAEYLKFYGQEINLTTYNLCRINMILHNVQYQNFDICNEDTLTSPSEYHSDLEPFEAIVSNPPYSISWKGDSDPILINDPRFAPAGVLAPNSKADLAFVLHSLAWLAPNGAAAIVCFPGIMYRSGKEQKIRRYLVANNFVDCVIQLPGNLFYGTSIATCVMVLRRNKKDNNVLFIDASREFAKVTNNNKLTPDNIAKIVGVYKSRETVEYFSRLVSYEEVREQDFNLSVSTYIEQKDEREQIDVVRLNREIREIVSRENELRDAIEKIVAEIEGNESGTASELPVKKTTGAKKTSGTNKRTTRKTARKTSQTPLIDEGN